MLDAINWQPFIFTAWIVGGFIVLCFGAVAGDIWAKGCRPKTVRRSAVRTLNGERIYLN
jgi:hypothetical protein